MQKKYWEMTTEELQAATAEFDQEFVAEKSRPLTAARRAEWERTRAALNRTAASESVKPATVRVDPPLAKKLTALAKKRKVSRTRLVHDLLTAAVARLNAE
jgi:predicted HicB family RNase H-like nuclease